jgi:hypothetical protein
MPTTSVFGLDTAISSFSKVRDMISAQLDREATSDHCGKEPGKIYA